jgi:prepilin-type N-terminal cleavage/methylation domain-containing protein
MKRMRSARGFTLIELVVAMALLGTVLAVALTGFQNLSDAGDGASLTTDLNVNLRSTLNLMTRDLISAGRDIPVGGIGVPSGANSVPIIRPSPDDGLTFNVGPAMPAVTPGDGLGPLVGPGEDGEGAETDVLTILMADTTLPLDMPLDDVAADGTSVTFAASVDIDNSDNGIEEGDLLMIRDPKLSTALVMVTERNGQTVIFGNDPMHLNQPDAEAGSIVRLQNPLNDDGSAPENLYPAGMVARRILMLTYYIDNSDEEKPKLMRRVNMRPARAIGVVVENLQVTYDIADGVNNPTNQPAPANPNQIRKANLFVAGRSHREWRRTRDFLRTSVATQVSLRSLAFVDRYK